MMAFPRVLSGLWWGCWPHCELSLEWKGAKQSHLGRLKQLLLCLFNGHCSFLTMVFGMLLKSLTEFSKNHMSLSKGTCKCLPVKGRSPEDWQCCTCLLNSWYLRGMLLLAYTSSPFSSTWEEERDKKMKFNWHHYQLFLMAGCLLSTNRLGLLYMT